ncbi:MAG: YfhO family protein [Candidatus Glassbacteria bacterium]|nr:YfhO family protein [Candidatus Glassbacteria bacterium]
MNAAANRKPGRNRNDGRSQPEPGRDPLPSYVPYALLAALTLVFFWGLFSPSSRNWLWEDFLYFAHPARMFAAYCFSIGEFPFWNPYVFGGQPFFADIQTAVLYPFNLIHSLLAGGQTGSYLLLELIEVFHFFLAGFFTFRFLRLTGADQQGSLLGAITFAFSGYLVTHAIHTNFVFVFIWLPLVLELFERALGSGKFRYAIICAAVLAVSTAGGYPQYTLYIYYVLALYWLVNEIFSARSAGWRRSATVTRAAVLGFITAAALGLNLVSWLPAAELAEYTPRSEMSYEASVEHSLEPRMLLKLVAPRFFGTQYPEQNTYWAGGYGSFWETCLFVGILPLALALFGLKGARRNRHLAFAAALTFICLWLALGRYGLLYKLFFHVAPGFGKFRHPGRFAGLASLGLALLAAHGWTMLAVEINAKATGFFSSRLFYILLGICAVLALAYVWGGSGLDDPRLAMISRTAVIMSAGWVLLAFLLLASVWYLGRDSRRAAWLGLAVCLAAFGELYWFGVPSISGSRSPTDLYQDNSAVRRFRRDAEQELFRINARSLENPGAMVLRRNQGSIHRLFLIEGYNPLQLERRLKDVARERRFDLMNVKYAIYIDQEKQQMGMELRSGYLPRAFMAVNWRVIGEDGEILAALNDSGFDHKSEVVLESDPGIEPGEPPAAGQAAAEVVKYTPGEIVVRTECAANAVLVLSEWHYPAWSASVDGRPAEMLRADYALRAVALEAGIHEVRFAYESDKFRTGLFLSLISLAGLLVAGAVSVKLGKF